MKLSLILHRPYTKTQLMLSYCLPQWNLVECPYLQIFQDTSFLSAQFSFRTTSKGLSYEPKSAWPVSLVQFKGLVVEATVL